MAALVDVDKMTHEDAAKKWLADNEAVWKAITKLKKIPYLFYKRSKNFL